MSYLPTMKAMVEVMKYMLNVDLDQKNESGGEDCKSDLHLDIGRHADLTVHRLGCGHRPEGTVRRPELRWWDDNNGEGYTLKEIIQVIHQMQSEHSDAYPRRAKRCGVEANLPHWD